jgi:uncharacterized protein YggE
MIMKPLTMLSIPVALLAAALAAPTGSHSPDPQSGIHVTGSGEANLKPDVVLIRGEFSSSADTSAEALTKFRDGRRRAVKMIESLGMEGLTITGSGPALAVAPALNSRDMRMMMGIDASQTDVEGKFHARETLTIRLGNPTESDASSDAIAKVLDKAKEAGIKVSPALDAMPSYVRLALGMSSEEQKEAVPPIVYVVSDRAKLEEAACVKAMEDATRRATMLARLAGRKLGRVVSLSHSAPPAEKVSFDGAYRVTLQVVFELAE